MMKRLVCLMLALVVLLSAVGCTKTEKLGVMPFGLEFGENEGTFKAAVEAAGYEAPALKPADANNGYFVTLDTDKSVEEVAPLLGLDEITEDFMLKCGVVDFSFSFNQDKELYEFYCMMYTFPDNENFDAMVDNIIAQYDAKLGVANTGSADGGIANWEKDGVTLQLGMVSDSVLALVFHDTNHDLDS